MRTREKVVILVVVATLMLGALIFISFRNNEVEANHFRWLLANNLKFGLSSPGTFLDELPPGTLFYGGLIIFAVAMVVVVLKMVRDGEIQALRRHLLNLRAEKNQTESLLQEEVWRGKHERLARDSVMKDLESSIEKIESLIGELNEKERLLKVRETELMAAKSSAIEFADLESSNDPAERLLRKELKRKNEILQSRDSTIKELEQRLSAKARLWENQLREKDGLLKGRERELNGLQTEIVDLGQRLADVEAAKKRAEDLLHEELRQKKEVLEANDLAIRTEEKRLSEKIRILESQASEKEKLLRSRETEINGFRQQLSELESVKAEMAGRFQQELGKLEQDRLAKEQLIKDLEQWLSTNIHALQNEVGEKDLLLQARDGELKSLASEVKAISLRLSEMAAAKVRVEESLQEELKKEKWCYEAEQAASREREDRYEKEVNLLTQRLGEKDDSLKRRDAEIEAIQEEVRAIGLRFEGAVAAKDRAEALLQEELAKEKVERKAKEAANRELEQRHGKEIQTLKSQLDEKEESLQSRAEDIKSLKTQVSSLAGQLTKVGSAKERAASLLQQKLRAEKAGLEANDSAVREIEETFKARIAALQEQLATKQELVGSRDRELAALKSELAAMNQRMADLASAKERAESLFEDALKERTDLLESKDVGLRKLKEELSGRIHGLESRLREKEEVLHGRESELTAVKNQLAELAASSDQSARLLNEDLRQKSELLNAKETAIKALEERFNIGIQTLESELSEKQELLEARDRELKGLMSRVNNLSGDLAELGNSRDSALRLLQEELKRKTDLLDLKESALTALEERLNGKVSFLENQVDEKQEFLDARDTEVDTLMAKVSELTQKLGELSTERERSDRLLQEGLREKTALLQSKETTIGELEERLKGRVESLDRQLTEKQKLLEARGEELSDLRAQMNDMTERLNETETAKVHLEGLLQQERNKVDRALVAVESSRQPASHGSNGEAPDMDGLLSEREQLLKARDKVIQDLMTELKDKKKQLAKQEIQVWQKIERREAWKYRLSKFGIRIKD